MIIFGHRTYTGAKGKGQFHCPGCASRQGYKHQSARSWFHLYFIPVIPLGAVSEHVTCDRCKSSWMPGVLQNDPERQQAEFMAGIERGWLNSAASVLVSRGGPTPETSAMIAADIASLTGRPVASADVEAVAAQISRPVNDALIPQTLGPLIISLNSTGHERYLTSIIKALAKLTNCGPAEAALVRALGKSLGMSDAHVNGILLNAGMQGV